MIQEPIEYIAWNKTTKQMIDLRKITPLALSHPDIEGIFLPFMEDIILRPYISLLDTDRNKIFLGDVLECNDSDIGGFKGRGEVIFCNDLCLVPAPGYYLRVIPGGGVLTMQFPFNRKIIGNIYQDEEFIDMRQSNGS